MEGTLWQQTGMLIGGLISGLIAGVVFWSKYLQKQGPKTAEHRLLVPRDEFQVAIAELRVKMEDTATEAREARAAAAAAQAGLSTIGQLIESSMRQLGDRLEGALRDMRDRVDDHNEQIADHHGRLRSVETELRLGRLHRGQE